MNYILTTDNLTKLYGKNPAADNVNIHIKKGEIYGLIGRNGAGKTTVLRIISGLSNATSGSYSINGKTGRELASQRNKVGALIENPGLYPNMTAYENLKLKAIAMGKNDKAYLLELLAMVGLSHAAHKKTYAFSLGMRQRLGIALALVGDPEILVLDEPINGLDPQGIAEIRQILTRLSTEKGITIVLSSHILDELSKIADSYGIIHEGKLIDEISSQELHARCSEFVILRTGDNTRALEVLARMGISGAQAVDEATLKITGNIHRNEEIVEALIQAAVGVREIYISRHTLEEYYLNLTGGPNHG